MKLGKTIAAIGAAILWQALPTTAAAQSLTEVTGFGTNPGQLRAFKVVPQGLPANPPLVVALHGCSQTASGFDDETGWVKFADMGKFALLLPQQEVPNNPNKCFNWFEAGDIQRDRGEALSIKQMIDKTVSDHDIDPKRIYIAGLSAGAGMTVVMLATYPELFAGGATSAGLPYKCATNMGAAFGCMGQGRNLSPMQWGDLVRAASSHQSEWPRLSIWQGTADKTVNPVNATELIEQWTNIHGIDQTLDGEDTVDGHIHRVFKDANGKVLVESFTIAGMDHGISINPGSGESQCGTAASWILDKDICTSFHVAKFWGLLSSDPTSMTREEMLQRVEEIERQIDQLTKEMNRLREALGQAAGSGKSSPTFSVSKFTSVN